MDILGQSDINAYLSTIVQALNTVNQNIEQTNADLGVLAGKLQQIYERLEHVKVDSYVNARIVDALGLVPLPATEATGLLVTAYAANPDHTVNVNVVNTSVPVDVTNTAVDVNITNEQVNTRPHIGDIGDGLWKPMVGYKPERIGYQGPDGLFHYWSPDNVTIPLGWGGGMPVSAEHTYFYLNNMSFVTSGSGAPYTTATVNTTNYALP